MPQSNSLGSTTAQHPCIEQSRKRTRHRTLHCLIKRLIKDLEFREDSLRIRVSKLSDQTFIQLFVLFLTSTDTCFSLHGTPLEMRPTKASSGLRLTLVPPCFMSASVHKVQWRELNFLHNSCSVGARPALDHDACLDAGSMKSEASLTRRIKLLHSLCVINIGVDKVGNNHSCFLGYECTNSSPMKLQ